MEFSRQEYWNGLPYPTPRDLPDPGIELMFLESPALAGGVLPLVPPGKLRKGKNYIKRAYHPVKIVIFRNRGGHTQKCVKKRLQ